MIEVEPAPAAKEHVSAEPGDGQAGENAQPGIKLLGHDVSRGIEGDGAQRKNARSVGSGDNQAEQERMARSTPRAYQVSGYDRFAVTRFQRVQCAEAQRYKAGSDEEPETQAAGGDQLGECAAWGCLLVGLEVQRLVQPCGRGHVARGAARLGAGRVKGG